MYVGDEWVGAWAGGGERVRGDESLCSLSLVSSNPVSLQCSQVKTPTPVLLPSQTLSFLAFLSWSRPWKKTVPVQSDSGVVASLEADGRLVDNAEYKVVLGYREKRKRQE